MTPVHHMALKVSHISKGKGISLVHVSTRRHMYLAFSEFKNEMRSQMKTTDATSSASK